MKIQARKLLEYSTDELWDLLNGTFTLVFDDGVELQTNDRETLYSAYVWEYHRRSGAPLLAEHHVGSILRGDRLRSDTHLKLIAKVSWSVYEYLQAKESSEDAKLELRYQLAELAYRVTNTMYNDLLRRLEPYVGSLDITDFFEVLDHPAIMEAYDKLQPTPRSIDETYATISATLRNKEALGHNPLSRLSRSGLVSEKQVHQCLGPRGFITDVDSNQFREPVLRGYAEGLRSLYDTLIESRSAAKSLVFSKEPLQDAEYFSRRLQLMSMSVENLHHTDCGSQHYLHWTVRGREMIGGEVIYDGDMRHLVGKWYLDEATGELKEIRAIDKHLIGQRIKLRSILHCRHPDPAGVCAKCFGTLSLSIPRYSNLGHMCAAFTTQQTSQAVLSVKHLDGSAVIEVIMLSDGDKHFLKVGTDGNSYLLADALKKKKVSLVISAAEAQGLTDVLEVDDVTILSLTRVSQLSNIGVMVDDGKIVREDTAEVHMDKRLSSLTYEMLEYIREHGWTTDSRGHYVIDMSQWDWSKPISQLPLRHFNMSDHSKEIADMLEASKEEARERDQHINPSDYLVEFFNLVNSKLSVNLAVLEVVIYQAMIVSAEDCDYSLPKPWTKSGLGVKNNTMKNRSLSTAMAFERHPEVILSPESFVFTNRPEHVFDGLLMPREVVESGTRQR